MDTRTKSRTYMPGWICVRITKPSPPLPLNPFFLVGDQVKDRFPRLTTLQWLVHVGALLPLLSLFYDAFTGNLTANPIQYLTVRTGKFALIFLIISLACTPINTVFGFRQVLRVRRALGLYAFFYASIHFLIFIGLDYGLNWNLIKEAIFEKRFALVGFAAFLILLPLAITSTRTWMKRLGKNWTRLHRFVYLAGVLVIIHYVWLVKSDIRIPLLYGAVVVLLLIARIKLVRKAISRFRQIRLNRILHKIPLKLPG
jgi:sulfoxide reductase heme-binding subunit YedZ